MVMGGDGINSLSGRGIVILASKKRYFVRVCENRSQYPRIKHHINGIRDVSMASKLLFSSIGKVTNFVSLKRQHSIL